MLSSPKKIKWLKYNRCGQAVVELAIFGSLILFAFSMLLTYGQRLDGQQQVKMDAFRKALQNAYYRNSSVSYTIKRDTHNADLFAEYGKGQNSSSGASGSVMWVKGAPGEEESTDQLSYAFYQVNDNLLGNPETGLERRPKTIINSIGKEVETMSPVSVWKEHKNMTSDYDGSLVPGAYVTVKQEGPAGITNSREARLQETLTTDEFTRFNDKCYDSGGHLVNCDVEASPSEQRPAFNYTTPEYPTTQGAYQKDNNRIAYSEANVGTVIQKGRTWQTGN